MSRTDYNRPGSSGAFDLAYHREMIADPTRVGAIVRAIDALGAPDGSFLELGAGTGIFSIYAARRFGRVVAVERDSAALDVARASARRAGADNIVWIQADVFELDLRDRFDVVLCEMISTGLIHEPVAPALGRAAAEWLSPGGATIPSSIACLAELAEAQVRFGEVDLPVPYYQFSGIPSPTILSESRVFMRHSFQEAITTGVDSRVAFRTIGSGTVNAIRVTAVAQLAPGVAFYSTDSLQPPVILPVDQPTRVDDGERLDLRIRYRFATDLDAVSVALYPSDRDDAESCIVRPNP